MRAVRRALETGVGSASRELGVPRRSLHRWLARYQETGIDGLVERSRRPLELRPTIPAWVDRIIITVRLLTYWNSKRISAELARRRIYELALDQRQDRGFLGRPAAGGARSSALQKLP